jgi:hypothetical protein
MATDTEQERRRLRTLKSRLRYWNNPLPSNPMKRTLRAKEFNKRPILPAILCFTLSKIMPKACGSFI